MVTLLSVYVCVVFSGSILRYVFGYKRSTKLSNIVLYRKEKISNVFGRS